MENQYGSNEPDPIAPSAVGQEHPDADEHDRDRYDRDGAAQARGNAAPELDAPDARDQSGFEPGEPDPESIRALELDPRSAAAIVPRRVSWLWRNYLALGKVSIMDGRPGLAKSCMTLDLGARVTRGLRMPDGSVGLDHPANVIVITAEDDWEDTVVPRLMAVGADLSRVFPVNDLSMPEGCDRLEEAIKDFEARLVVVDPLVAFVPGKFNLYRDQEARSVLRPVADVMARTDAAFLGLRHVNKNVGSPAQDRGTGSVGIGGAARSNLIVGPDPDKMDSMVLASIKNNLGPPPPSLSYSVGTKSVNLPDGPAEMPIIVWGEAVDLDADDLVVPERQGEAARWLEGFLADGPKPAKEVKAAAEAEGLSWTGAVRRASDRLGVIKSTPEVGKPGVGWTWALP